MYRLSEESEWIEVDRLEIELAPQRTQVDLTPTGWALPDGALAAWFTVRGGTGAHAGTLNIIRIDGKTLRTELSSRGYEFHGIPGAAPDQPGPTPLPRRTTRNPPAPTPR